MATLPLKRKIERAFAGYLVDQQRADPTFLPGFAVVCGSTGRSPDDPQEAQGKPTEPDLPYLSVSCAHARERADFPSGYGMKEAELVLFSKTHVGDECRANADGREAAVAARFDDADAIVLALNQPPVATTPDTRRQQDLYLYAIEDVEAADEHTGVTWEDELRAKVVCQGFDPDYA